MKDLKQEIRNQIENVLNTVPCMSEDLDRATDSIMELFKNQELYQKGYDEGCKDMESAREQGREEALTEAIEAGEKIKLNVGHPDWRSAVDCYQSKIKSLSANQK